ncbi:MAG: hypothetical protein KatS3mg076_0141 [Candidatus Binatia bacterium]|nr:MAG: hypothetical protein KatS3mg076_0141 [Candidatus Binatia bacterium]
MGPGDDTTKYSGITFVGIDVDDDNELNLDGSEYAACPTGLRFPHIAQGAEDPVLGTGSTVTARLTLVPCTQNFEDRFIPRVSVSVTSYNEVEAFTSGQFEFDCWFDSELDAVSLGNPDLFASTVGAFKQSILTPSPVCVGGDRNGLPCNPQNPNCPNGGSCTGVVGILGVLETTHNSGAAVSRSAQTLHSSGDDAPGAVITTVAN